MKPRTTEREQWLSDVLVTAIEHAGYGFPGTIEYSPEPDGKPSDTYAVIYDRYDVADRLGDDWHVTENGTLANDAGEPAPDVETWRVDIDTIAKGFGRLRRSLSGKQVAEWARELLAADRTNGEDGDCDVIGALLVLEFALFGEQKYS